VAEIEFLSGVCCRSSRIPILDPIFLADSYGYRPNKSALDAVGVTRERCWKCDWVLEFDIKGLFDNIDHELLLRAVRIHITCKWALLYIERWLRAPMVLEDGTTKERSCGTPQGGVASPILGNLFMHYAFDVWMTRTHPELPWCRYADDGLLHCRSEQEAEPSRLRFKPGWRSAIWKCIRRRPRSSTAKTGSEKVNIRTSNWTFLGIAFGLVGSDVSGITHCLEDSIQQSVPRR
jgi:RNA-directed DNA polymerase